LTAFLTDSSSDKRAKVITDLLARNQGYADHWLTFWNDLLRNAYDGTGFITGGATHRRMDGQGARDAQRGHAGFPLLHVLI